MNMPSHHQSEFFTAIRETGSDIKVCYYGSINAKRKELGWVEYHKLPEGEKFVDPCVSSVDTFHDWQERVHVIPGYGSIFLQKLVIRLCKEDCFWMHWSEPARPGLRWWASLPLKRWYAFMVNRHALGALAIGKMAQRDFLNWGIYNKKIAFLPYAVRGLEEIGNRDEEISKFRQRFNILFLFVGTICSRKGIDILLGAFGKLVRKFPSAGLALAGKEEGDNNYRRIVSQLGLAENVLFRGPVQASQIASVIRLGDVLVLPSRFDGWGMTLNEAASLGRALIATDQCGSAHHLIRNNENGFMVRACDRHELRIAMERYAVDSKLVQVHGSRSKEIFAEFTPAANVRRLQGAISKFMPGATIGIRGDEAL
jgi:glycosyltransferase involved in cell wall biosynthesis